MKIDDKTVVPIGWVLAAFGVSVGTVIAGSFWIASVNFRLERIEEKLDIPAYHSALDSINNAFAGDKDER